MNDNNSNTEVGIPVEIYRKAVNVYMNAFTSVIKELEQRGQDVNSQLAVDSAMAFGIMQVMLFTIDHPRDAFPLIDTSKIK